jgi:hypothetical protein
MRLSLMFLYASIKFAMVVDRRTSALEVDRNRFDDRRG